VRQSDAAISSVWILSDGKAGHLAMTTGVAAAMGLQERVIPVRPGWLWRRLAPRGPAPPDARALWTDAGTAWPDLAFAAGRLTIPYLRALRRDAGDQTLTVAFMDPRVPDAADLIWVPEHDARRGENVITTVTSPHGFSPERLALLRDEMPEAIAAMPAPRVTVLLGGPGAGFRFSKKVIARLVRGLKQMAELGASFMITPSRRTPPALLAAARGATANAPRIIWDGTWENPYPTFLACADAFVVTADSVNMTGEAAATGRPVYVFWPDNGRPKFHKFHAALEETGATRPLPDELAGLELWRYQPVVSAREIGAEIARHARARLMRVAKA